MNKLSKVMLCTALFSVLYVHARAEQSMDADSAMVESVVNDQKADEPKSVTNEMPAVLYSGDAQGETLAQQIKAVNDGPDWLKDVADRIQLHGYAQGGYLFNSAGGNRVNSFEIKRVLFWANAQITPRWSFCFMHDFSSVVQEYYTDFRITNNNMLKVRLGQFKTGLSYENALSPTSMETIDVYSEIVTFLTMCGSDPLLGVQYGRDLGISISGETTNKKFRYEFDVMNGSGINQKDKNTDKNYIAKLEFRPVKGLNIVASGQLGRGHAIKTSVFNPDIQVGDDYKSNRYTVGVAYSSLPFNVHAEYLEGKDGKAVSRGAYVTGSVKLAKLPKNTSLDFIGSYDYCNFNTKLGYDQHKIVAGLQYWFFKQCRFQVNYTYKNAYYTSSSFQHGAYHGIQCQMQVRFN